MSVNKSMRRGLAPLALAVAVACTLAACKKDPPAAEGAAATAAAQQAPAPTPQSVVSASVAAMNPDQLRTEASKAYADNRLYAPAGSNAMEYYLALRDKQPADAGASSALTDLLPMTVIATEQGIAREDFADAKRLAALIEKADAQHPALTRLKASIASTEVAVSQRAETQKLTAEEEAKRLADLAKQREEDQRRLQEHNSSRRPRRRRQAPPAARHRRCQPTRRARPRPNASGSLLQRPNASPATAATPPPAAATTQPARAASSNAAISQPGPRYPASAQRAGATADVQVEFTVSRDGDVSSARVVSSEGGRQFAREFEREALAAVKRWRFQPVAEATTSRRTISFRQ